MPATTHPTPMIAPALRPRGSTGPRQFLHVFILAFVSLAATPASGQVLEYLEEVRNRIVTLQTNVTNTFNQARSAAQQTAGLSTVITKIQEVYNTVDGPGKDLIESYVLMLRGLIEQQRDGFQAFITPNGAGVTPAAAFRTQLTALLADMTGLANDLVTFDGTLQFQLRIDVINRLVAILPDPLLYPFYVIMNRGLNIFDSGLVTQLAEMRAALPVARELLLPVAAVQDWDGAGSAETRSTGPLSQAQHVKFAANGQVLKVGGNTLAIIGKILGAWAESDEKEAKLGIHGYVGIHVKVQPLKVVSGLLEATGETLAKIGERVEKKLEDIESASRHQALLDGLAVLDTDQQTVIDNQGAIATGQTALLQQQETIIAGQTRIFDALKRIDPDLFPEVSKTPPAAALSLNDGPQRVQVDSGGPVALTAGPVESLNATYQWRKDGVNIEGAVYSTYSIRSASRDSAGVYDVLISDEAGTHTSAGAMVELIPGRVLNVSVRFTVPANGVMIAGFVLDSPKQVVIRGVGRSLSMFGIPEETTMQDPTITIYNKHGQIVNSNDNYEATPESNATMNAVGAFPLIADTDAALITTLPAGAYTVHLRGADASGGDCIVEVYDTDLT